MPNRKELDGLMGMYEMEMAIEVMLQKSEKTGTPFGALLMYPGEFPGDGSLVGFCQLLARGYMTTGYPNGEFKVDKSLTEHMRKSRDCWKDLTDPPTWDEWFKARFQMPVGTTPDQLLGP